MPAAVIGGVVSGVGSVAGGVAAGKGAAKAAAIQQQTSREQMQFAQNMYDKTAATYAPDITYGNRASDAISNLLGIGNGGTAAATQAQQDAFKNWRDSTGYQFNLNQGLNAINSNAYAQGAGNSGATMKALQDRGNQVADTYFGNYLSQLGGQQAVGMQAKGAMAGQGNNLVNAQQVSSQKAADAAGAAAVRNGELWGSIISGLSKQAGGYLGSSFGNNNNGSNYVVNTRGSFNPNGFSIGGY